jgi:hypothetical protein
MARAALALAAVAAGLIAPVTSYDIAPVTSDMTNAAAQIISTLLPPGGVAQDSPNAVAWKRLAFITDTFGPRFSGSANLEVRKGGLRTRGETREALFRPSLIVLARAPDFDFSARISAAPGRSRLFVVHWIRCCSLTQSADARWGPSGAAFTRTNTLTLGPPPSLSPFSISGRPLLDP